MSQRQWRFIAIFCGVIITTGVSNTLGTAARYAPEGVYRDVVTLRWLTMGIALAACAYCAIEAGRVLAQMLRKDEPAERTTDDVEQTLEDLLGVDDGPSVREVW